MAMGRSSSAIDEGGFMLPLSRRAAPPQFIPSPDHMMLIKTDLILSFGLESPLFGRSQ
jgi:hypothetical protein